MSLPQEPIYSTLSNDPELGDLVEEFVGSLRERVTALGSAVASGDLAGLTRLAHQLKGSSGGYGFDIIGRAAGALEQAARTATDVQSLNDQVGELIDLCARATARPPA